jgi:bifunctional DNA-binding transcriptional regulator/antitoxin component of YhaV-PrlF toxin-antitoxin module
MGQEVVCTARWSGKTVRGKALLETAEIIFRGDERLKIPFAAIRGMEARDGELRLKTDEGMVIFELGDRAEKWREKIANPKSVVEKLGVKPGERVTVFGRLDGEFLEKLKAQKSAATPGKIVDGVGWIFFGAETREGLSGVKKIAVKMKGSAALWVVYPKGQKGITETDVIGAGRKAGLKDVKVVGFTATHTALKLVIPIEKR